MSQRFLVFCALIATLSLLIAAEAAASPPSNFVSLTQIKLPCPDKAFRGCYTKKQRIVADDCDEAYQHKSVSACCSVDSDQSDRKEACDLKEEDLVCNTPKPCKKIHG